MSMYYNEPLTPESLVRLLYSFDAQAEDATELCHTAAARIELLESKIDETISKLTQGAELMEHAHEMIQDLSQRNQDLEKTMWTMHNEAHEHIKRIDELKALLRDFVAGDATVLE